MLILLTLFDLVWNSHYAPTFSREVLKVSLFKKGNKEDPVKYRGITLLGVIGKLYRRAIT